MLGLEKVHAPQVHKSASSVDAKLKAVKHVIGIKPEVATGPLTEEALSPVGQEAITP